MKHWMKWVFIFSLVGLLTSGMGPDVARAELTFSFVDGGDAPQSGDHNCSFADIDNDGIDELYTNYWPKKCYKFKDGIWQDISSTTGGLCSETRTGDHGLVFFDVDNDGDFDFMDDDNYLYGNDGLGFFSNLSASVGLESYLLKGEVQAGVYPLGVIFRTRGVSAGDIDRDGDNDVWVTGDGYHLGDYLPPRNYLFINQLKETGALSFIEDAANRGQDSYGDMSDNRYRPQYVRQGSMFFDYDDDGDLDLYITVNGSEGWTEGPYCCEAKNEMWENDGTGYFTEVAEVRGIKAPNSGGGTNVGDLDNDGYLDVVVDAARIYRYDPMNNVYVLEQVFGFPGFASCVGDFDHDGDLDIYPAGTNVILENQIQERGWENGFVSRTVIAGGSDDWPGLDARGCAVADFDNDGDMDIYWTHMAPKPWYGKTRGFLLRNDLPLNNSWLKVKLRGPHGDAGAPGAKVKVYQGGHAGDMNYFVARRDAISVQAYMDNHSQVLHFGLAEGQTYDVVVTFLTGETRTLSHVAPGELLFVDAVGAGGDDDQPPVISNIASSNIFSNSATITWLTNEAADSQVEYGVTTGYGSSSALNTSLVTAHSVTLSGLSVNTTYHYRVKSKDAAGNLAVSGDDTFTTTDSSVRASLRLVTSNYAYPGEGWDNAIDGDIAGWDGTVSASASPPYAIFAFTDDGIKLVSRVRLLTDTGVGFSARWVTQFTVQISTTDTSTSSFTTVLDKASKSGGTWQEYNFTPTSAKYLKLILDKPDSDWRQIGEFEVYVGGTPPPPDTQAPVISSVASSGITSSGATITWSTNEAADSLVEYGLSTGYGSSSPLNTGLVMAHSVTLSGLSANTTYHYRVKSKDAAGNLTVSDDYTFTTAGSSSAARAPLRLVTSNYAYPGEGWDNAIDGDIAGWDGTVSASASPPYAIFAFTDNGIKLVSKVRLLTDTGVGFSARWVTQFTVQVSTTDTSTSSFTTVLNKVSKSGGAWQEYILAPTNAKYLKLILDKPDSEWRQIGEFEVWINP